MTAYQNWIDGATAALADEWVPFDGYIGANTGHEAEQMLRTLQGFEYEWTPEGARPYPAAPGWESGDYALDALSDGDGLTVGYQFTRMRVEDGGLYFGIFLDWKDLTFDVDATGVVAARAYIAAMENARERLDGLIANYGRPKDAPQTSTADLDQRDRNLST